jgi:hypothetical protein
LAGVPDDEIKRAQERKPTKHSRDYLSDLERARLHRRLAGDQWTRDDHERLWALLRWLDETDLHIVVSPAMSAGFIVSTGPVRVVPRPR